MISKLDEILNRTSKGYDYVYNSIKSYWLYKYLVYNNNVDNIKFSRLDSCFLLSKLNDFTFITIKISKLK